MTSSLFRSLYHQGFVRVATCTVPVTLADPLQNIKHVLEVVEHCDQEEVLLCVFQELGLTGYSLEDLFHQEVLLNAVKIALEKLVKATEKRRPIIVVGAPLVHRSALYNCAVVVHRGHILGIVPKTYLPGYREFYEPRYFTSGGAIKGQSLSLCGENVPFGVDLLFESQDSSGFCLGVELCEDVWVPIPPSSAMAVAGATVLANLSASNSTIGKAETRAMLCRSHSARCVSAYLYATAGEGESSTDLAWDGQTAIFENGQLLAQSDSFPTGARALIADVDITLLRQERLRRGGFNDVSPENDSWRRIGVQLAQKLEKEREKTPKKAAIDLRRPLLRFPFMATARESLEMECLEAFSIQVAALKQRLLTCGARSMVIGVSGGLDSTHALLVAVRTAESLGWSRQAVLGYTMPGFGTTETTKTNATALMEELGICAHTLDIRPTAEVMLREMGHPFASGKPVYDITFENVQAGLRTDFLFRLANQYHGIVIGTGDLSELALGWCTYGVGDQMAHYSVNAGLPKTFIQSLVRWCSTTDYFTPAVRERLHAVLQTEISPELVPVGEKGNQRTEDIIGPYALHDFTLYYVLRYGFSPTRIAFMAEQAWHDVHKGEWPYGFPDHEKRAYHLAEIRHWLKIFLQRFFTTSQFKRSALPNAPKIMAAGSLSPRGDWRVPSDTQARLWLEDLENHVPQG
ncbi:MAG: NAD(+) synthase [Acetobacter sp.]|nr:NAD(+) synthase [Acetobacter sp.]